MKKYIDADKLIETLIELQEIPTPGLAKVTNEAISLGLSLAVREVRKSPVADVEEVKLGYNKSSMNPVDEFICSECGAMFADVSLVKEDEENGDINYYEFEFKYCPNCGAKMSAIPIGSKRSVDG